MYLFKYLLNVSDESVGEIKTSLNAISLLPMLIDQYKIQNTNNNKYISNDEISVSSDNDNDIIMDKYVVLIQTNQTRKQKQRKYFKKYNQHHSSSMHSNQSQSSITDKQEFLNFFDDEVNKNDK